MEPEGHLIWMISQGGGYPQVLDCSSSSTLVMQGSHFQSLPREGGSGSFAHSVPYPVEAPLKSTKMLQVPLSTGRIQK